MEVQKLEIYLKSGHTLEVDCKIWNFEFNNSTGEYTSYEFKGLSNPRKIGIAPNQIAGYIVKGRN